MSSASAPVPLTTLQTTGTPATGFPLASVTRATKGASARPAVSLWASPPCFAIAAGAHVMILDGDDALEGPPDAIAQALALARQAGAVVVPSIVRDPVGVEVRRMPPAGTARFGFAAWREAFSSLHLLVRRDLVQPFSDFRLIDDVLFDLRALAAVGGEAPVAPALSYRYQLRPGQATDTPWEGFDAEYARALAAIRADGFGFGVHAGPAAQVLRRWKAMNRMVGTQPGLGDYHRAVAAYLGRRAGRAGPDGRPAAGAAEAEGPGLRS